MTHLTVNGGCCNEYYFNTLDLSVFTQLESIEIASKSFRHTKHVKIIKLERLERVAIGRECFTILQPFMESYKDTDRGHTFSLCDCPALKEVKIGDLAFKDFSTFNLSGVPSLVSLELGKTCFINAKRVSLTEMKHLDHITMGNACFSKKEGSFVLKDCPVLRSIQTGNDCFIDFTVFQMEGVNALTTVELGDSSFGNVAKVEFVGLPSLEILRVNDCSFKPRICDRCRPNGDFTITNCPLLKELYFGFRACQFFVTFNVSDLPSLESLTMGELLSDYPCGCFTMSSLELKSVSRRMAEE